jgi:hypothetical protein
MSILSALQDHIAKHAMTYLMAMMLGIAASFTAVYDNFWILERETADKLGWWHWVALWAKCLAPFATTVVAYLIKSPIANEQPPTK